MAYRELTDEEEQRCETAHALIEALEGSGVTFRLVDGKVRFKPASRVGKVGKAALERYKAEIYELLREEAEYEARREALLANQPETDPMPDDEWEELEELSQEQRWALYQWIGESLEAATPADGSFARYDSYYLKHVFERSPDGFYVTDAQFRAAMWLGGFLGRRYPGKHYEDLESRYYYVRPNREGLIKKLVEHAGVPEGWAREALNERSE
jgi:PAS domain-containing protein